MNSEYCYFNNNYLLSDQEYCKGSTNTYSLISNQIDQMKYYSVINNNDQVVLPELSMNVRVKEQVLQSTGDIPLRSQVVLLNDYNKCKYKN